MWFSSSLPGAFVSRANYLLRWEGEIRDAGALTLPGDASEVGLTERELRMGEQLVLDLADEWHPERFRDEFREKIAQLVEPKRKSGEVRHVEPLDEEASGLSAVIVDLTELLRRSLRGEAPAAKTSTALRSHHPAARRWRRRTDAGTSSCSGREDATEGPSRRAPVNRKKLAK